MLSHLDQNNLPTMVDVSDKKVSVRSAQAMTQVQLPREMRTFLTGEELYLKKGPVFQTAIIAGTMAVKKTHEVIPFCHQLPIESCKFAITIDEELLVTIVCTVKTTHKTGVEMEALHGASVAGLTIYDMCKAVSHQMTIKETKLLSKTGGKRTILSRPTYGLVLTGGKSLRMERDKALIEYRGMPHGAFIYELLKGSCEEVFLSSRSGQWVGSPLEKYPTITDQGDGPIGGILSAMDKYPDVNWLVVACDLVHLNEETIVTLLSECDESQVATCFRNRDKDFPEALCAIYTPRAREVFQKAQRNDIKCPVKVLKNSSCKVIDQTTGINLTNVNTKQEFQEVIGEIN